MDSLVVDTCILIDALRRKPKAVEWLNSNRSKLLMPSIVFIELLHPKQGHSLSQAQVREIEKFTRRLPRVHPNASDWARARKLMLNWNPTLTRPDIPDIIIAATATGLRVPVCTLNVVDFENIPGCECVIPY